MNLVFSRESWEEYLYWQDTDQQTLKRINHLLKDTLRDPYHGIGKPEPLRHAFQGSVLENGTVLYDGGE